jgi:hypothetical protein
MRKLAILAAVTALVLIGPAAAAELAPHEASFTSTLQKYHGPGTVDSWEGTTHYRLSRDCQKWISETQVVYHFTVNGAASEIKVQSKSYEALDGHRLEFESILVVNGQTKSHTKGRATLKGKTGVAAYQLPASETVELPAGTMFPVASRREAMAFAATGKKRWKQLVFDDGQLIDYAYDVVDRSAKPSSKPKGDILLVAGPGWMIDTRMSSRMSGMNIQMETLAHPSGAVSQFLQYNPLYDTSEMLVQIRALPSPQC